MRRRPQRPDRIVPPGWDDLSQAQDDLRPVTSPFGCLLMALGWAGLLTLLLLGLWALCR